MKLVFSNAFNNKKVRIHPDSIQKHVEQQLSTFKSPHNRSFLLSTPRFQSQGIFPPEIQCSTYKCIQTECFETCGC